MKIHAVVLAALAASIATTAPSTARADDIANLDVDLGGYIQPGFVLVDNSPFNEDDHDGFEFANARLIGEAWQTFNTELGAELKFNFDVNQGNFAVRDVYGSLKYRDSFLALDVGQMKTPFGLALLQSEARMQLPFSPASRQLSFGRDLGARLRGHLEPKGIGVSWSAMVVNGEGGFRQRRNIDDKYLFVGRLEVTPMGPVGDDEADLIGGPLRVAIAVNGGYTKKLGASLGLDDVGAREYRGGADLRVKWDGISVRGELVLGERGDNDASMGFSRYGFYGQAGYTLPWMLGPAHFEVVGRFEQLDINNADDGCATPACEQDTYVVENTEVRTYEAGLTTYLAGQNAKALLAYRRTDMLEGPVVDVNGGPLIGDSLVLFLQLGWL